MAFEGVLPDRPAADGGWGDGGGGGGGGGEEERVEDEFACAGVLRGALLSLHTSMERVFGVALEIGADEGADAPRGGGQIWLKLSGRRADVTAAKLFVRGVVNQEEQQEVCYPEVLHCVFCGARGLFMDCLIKSTSAHLVVGSPGFLLISGLAEPVVKAYSLIADLVERYEDTQGRRAEPGDRGSGESLDSRRAFKSLVERWEDRHTLDLLVLPGAVKETLLDLVRESGLGSDPDRRGVSRAERVAQNQNQNQNQRRPWEAQAEPGNPTFPDGRAGPRAGAGESGISEIPAFAADKRPARSVAGVGARGGVAGSDDATAPRPSSRSPSPNGSRRGRAEGAELAGEGGGRRGGSPQEVGEEEEEDDHDEEEEESEDGGRLLSEGSREEFGLLLRFFTAMGYADRVVTRVLARTGPREASQVLDLIQQEQDRHDGGGGGGGRERNRPSEAEHGDGDGGKGEGGESGRGGGEEGAAASGEGGGAGAGGGGEGAPGVPDLGEVAPWGEREGEEGEGARPAGEGGGGGVEDDFVLGVLKRAAASCGYTEERVAEAYGALPELSTHQLLLQLQREEGVAAGAARGREGPREVDEDVVEGGVVEAQGQEEIKREEEEEEECRGREVEDWWTATAATKRGGGRSERGKREGQTDEGGGGGGGGGGGKTAPAKPPDRLRSASPPPRPPPGPAAAAVRGPPRLAYPPPAAAVATTLLLHPRPAVRAQLPRPPLARHHPPSLRIPEPRPVAGSPPAVVGGGAGGGGGGGRGLPVTGEQRFLEGLQATFDLQLTDEPGDPGLRMVVIDGSNVAMSHGLGHFFSCRGIALAVQHFWNRGHRLISTFLPRGRQKKDPKVKEQHFLTDLQNLGLLSYTPSREVQGRRINSYDDRFMLQLAQKTDGVIVTNDNLRDLLDESPVWRDIIKKRLLQYTFVGDHFMVPDDPLGRGGPHLDVFLRSDHRPPVPGSHSFAGVASSYPAPHSRAPPRAHTEVLHFRDRTPGFCAAPEPDRTGRTGQGRGRGQGGRGGAERGGAAERSATETARLRESLSQVFPGQDSMVTLVLQTNPTVTDVNSLSHLVLEQQGDVQQGETE